MDGTNAELAREGFEAALRGDLDAIADLLAPDVKWHGGDPSADGACRNREDALTVMRRASGLGSIKLVDVVESGDKVVVIMKPPGAAGGPVANLSTFRDGKVVEMVHYPDPDEALAAAGA
jgi:ketosteroid isomerase-like protein